MTEAQMDMSLDDIIKAKPSIARRGRGSGRGGGGRGGRSSNRGVNRRNNGNRSQPYSRDTPAGRWRHDKFEGGRMNTRGGRGNGMRGGDRGVTKLLISNLEYSVNDQDIRELFSEFGPIKTYSVHYDRSGRSLGTADVTYLYKSDATKALKTYNDVPLDGKAMRIELVADEMPVRENFGGGGFGGARRGGFGNRGGARREGGGGGGGGGGGRGRGRGRGGRGGGTPKTPMTAEELDKQLDEYKKKA